MTNISLTLDAESVTQILANYIDQNLLRPGKRARLTAVTASYQTAEETGYEGATEPKPNLMLSVTFETVTTQ